MKKLFVIYNPVNACFKLQYRCQEEIWKKYRPTRIYRRFTKWTIPRCTLVCNTLGSNWARSTYTYYVLLYVVHFRILFFSSFSLACSGGQILSKNRACKTWCYMYIPREVAPTTRLARLRKNGCTEFFLIWMIACNVDLSSMVRF